MRESIVILADINLSNLPELDNKLLQKHLQLNSRILPLNIGNIHRCCTNVDRVIGLPNSGDMLEI